MKRGGKLSPSSKERVADLSARRIVRERVFARDGGCVVADKTMWGPCFGPLTVHHLLKASQGGKYTAKNLVTLCAYHNGFVEDQPTMAWNEGLVIRSWEAK